MVAFRSFQNLSFFSKNLPYLQWNKKYGKKVEPNFYYVTKQYIRGTSMGKFSAPVMVLYQRIFKWKSFSLSYILESKEQISECTRIELAQKTTRVTNTRQHDTTRHNKMQHESNTRQHDITRVHHKTTRHKTRQQKYNTTQHE